MNKTEWDASNDPLPMLDWLRWRGSERKFRLFACACMRRVKAVLMGYYPETGVILSTAEHVADGGPTAVPPRHVERAIGTDPTRQAIIQAIRHLVEIVTTFSGWNSANEVPREIFNFVALHNKTALMPAIIESGMQAALVRDLFGHLFHPNPLWLARLIRADEAERIARAIYNDRAFADLPVLADALEEAGCSDPVVLEHCREPGEHARGCWVVDAVLGRQ